MKVGKKMTTNIAICYYTPKHTLAVGFLYGYKWVEFSLFKHVINHTTSTTIMGNAGYANMYTTEHSTAVCKLPLEYSTNAACLPR